MGGTVGWRSLPQRALLAPGAGWVGLGVGLLPLTLLWVGAFTDRLGPNPAETLIRSSGEWTLRFLCLTLAITPLRVLLGLSALARWRRRVGLLTALYALMHLLTYAWLDMGLDLADIVRDVAKRPFILVGLLAVLLLLPLVATSFDRAVKALGAARWRLLHRSVFVIAGLALLHFFWMRSAKNDLAEVAVYTVLVAALLAWRVQQAWRAWRSRVEPGPGASPDRPTR